MRILPIGMSVESRRGWNPSTLMSSSPPSISEILYVSFASTPTCSHVHHPPASLAPLARLTDLARRSGVSLDQPRTARSCPIRRHRRRMGIEHGSG